MAHFGGRIHAVAAAGKLAWLAQGRRVWAVDLTDPGQPRAQGVGLMLDGPVEALAVEGTLGLAAVGNELHTLDLTDAARPTLRGSVAVERLGRPVEHMAVGRLILFHGAAYVWFTPDWTWPFDQPEVDVHLLVDVRDPGKPAVAQEPLAVAPQGKVLEDIVRVGNTLVVAEVDLRPYPPVQAVQLLDLHDPLRPTAAGRIDSAPGLLVARRDTQPEQLVAVDLEYRPSQLTVAAWDVAVANAPRQIDRQQLPVDTDLLHFAYSAIYGEQGQLFLSGEVPIGSFYRAGAVFEVDPAGTQPGDRIRTVAYSTRPLDSPLAALGGLILGGAADGLIAYDPATDHEYDVPQVVDANGLAATRTAQGATLFANANEDGLHSLDVSDPRKPRLLGFARGHRSGQLTLGAGVAAVDDYGDTDIYNRAVNLVDVADPRALAKLVNIDLRNSPGAGEPLVIAQDGHQLAVRIGRGQTGLFDLATPASPRLATTSEVDGAVVGLAMDAGHLAVLSLRGGSTNGSGVRPLDLYLYRLTGLGGDAGAVLEDHVEVVPDAWMDGDTTDAVLTMAGGWIAVSLLGGCWWQGSWRGIKLYRVETGAPNAHIVPSAWIPWVAGSALLLYDGYLFVGAAGGVVVLDLRQTAALPWAWRAVGRLAVSDVLAMTALDHSVYVSMDEEGVSVFQPQLPWADDPTAPRPTAPPTPPPPSSTPVQAPCVSPTPVPSATASQSSTVGATPTRTPTGTPSPTPGAVKNRLYLPKVVAREDRALHAFGHVGANW